MRVTAMAVFAGSWTPTAALVFICLPFAVAGAVVSMAKGRSPLVGFGLGLLFNCIGLAMVLMSGSERDQ